MSNIAALEEQGIDLRGHTAGEMKTLCPRCSHLRKKAHEPCLSVNIDKAVWHCHNPTCGWSGTLAAREGRMRADRDGYGTIPRVYRPPKDYQPREQPPENKGWTYLQGRGITPLILAHYGVEYRTGVWMNDKRPSEGALCFPYYRGETLVNVKYRTHDKVMRQESGAEMILYGLNDIRAGQPLIWVEGEIDKLTFASAGEMRCVSPPNGAPNPGEKSKSRYRYLDTAMALIETASEHIIATDADPPGRALAEELIRRLGPERCRVVAWPEGCKDANDVFIAQGGDTLLALIPAAQPVPIKGIIRFDVTEMLDHFRRGPDPGVATSSARLSEHYTVRPGLLSIVTGYPSHGKSSFLAWLMIDLAARHGWRFGLCSPENRPVQAYGLRLISLHTGLPIWNGALGEFDIEDDAPWLREHVVNVLPEDDLTVEGVLEAARQLVHVSGINGLIIDPWNQLEHQRPAGMNETEYVSQCLSRFANFAARYNVHIWIAAHPAKPSLKDAAGLNPVPSLYEISGSAHWRNKADYGLCIYRHMGHTDQPTQVHIQKVRFAETGKFGLVEMYFDQDTGRFGDAPTGGAHTAWQEHAAGIVVPEREVLARRMEPREREDEPF